jgi:hypothetical protein
MPFFIKVKPQCIENVRNAIHIHGSSFGIKTSI